MLDGKLARAVPVRSVDVVFDVMLLESGPDRCYATAVVLGYLLRRSGLVKSLEFFRVNFVFDLSCHATSPCIGGLVF